MEPKLMNTYDPLAGAEIISLIGLDPARMTIPRVAAQVEEIIKHFANAPDKRHTILKVMMKSGDKLDNLWTYVQLAKEKQTRLKAFNPEDFEPDVAKEITDGHLTITSKARVRESIKRRKEEAKKKDLDANLQRQERKADGKVQEALPEEKLDFYSGQLKEIDALDEQLTQLQ